MNATHKSDGWDSSSPSRHITGVEGYQQPTPE